VILGGGVAVCLLLSAQRAVIFVIAQLSCVSPLHTGQEIGWELERLGNDLVCVELDVQALTE